MSSAGTDDLDGGPVRGTTRTLGAGVAGPATDSTTEDDEQARLARRLRDCRTQSGLSQQAVGDRVGLHRTAVLDIEAGRRRVNALELREFARLYLRPASYFLDDHDEPGSTMHILERCFLSLTAEQQRTVLDFAGFLRFRADHGRDRRRPFI